MNLKRSRIAPIVATAALLLAQGCATSNAPSPLLPAAAQSSSRNVGATGSWMTPQARKSTLIYALDERTGYVNVYDYADGTQVGTITGNFAIAAAGCVDARGDVYLASEGNILEYAHAGTKVLRTYAPGGDTVGCSVDLKGDLAVSNTQPGKVTVYAKGNPKHSASYSASLCVDQAAMGYDDKGDVIGEGTYSGVSICAVLAKSKEETTLTPSGITINSGNGTMWDGKYIALSDGEAGSGKNVTGIYQAKLSGSTITAHNETLLTDTCYRGYNFILNPFIVGTKNTPLNDRQAGVVVGVNAYCFMSSEGGLEYWHYPKGGNPFKMYPTSDELVVLAVSLPSLCVPTLPHRDGRDRRPRPDLAHSGAPTALAPESPAPR